MKQTRKPDYFYEMYSIKNTLPFQKNKVVEYISYDYCETSDELEDALRESRLMDERIKAKFPEGKCETIAIWRVYLKKPSVPYTALI